jgi:hypothetical protein
MILNFKLLIVTLLLFSINGFSQKDSLNNLNNNGKKNGVWKVYLDNSINPTDSSESYFYAYELWDNGKKVFKHYKHPNRLKVQYLEINIEQGKPILLNGTFHFYTKKGSLYSKEVYMNGKPLFIRSFLKEDNPLIISKGAEFLFFDKMLDEKPGTFYYEERNSKGVIFYKGWFKIGKKGWKVYKA